VPAGSLDPRTELRDASPPGYPLLHNGIGAGRRRARCTCLLRFVASGCHCSGGMIGQRRGGSRSGDHGRTRCPVRRQLGSANAKGLPGVGSRRNLVFRRPRVRRCIGLDPTCRAAHRIEAMAAGTELRILVVGQWLTAHASASPGDDLAPGIDPNTIRPTLSGAAIIGWLW
jgi:hypothetical protein